MKATKRASPSARPSFFRSGHSLRLHKPRSSRMKTAATVFVFERVFKARQQARRRQIKTGPPRQNSRFWKPDRVHHPARSIVLVVGPNELKWESLATADHRWCCCNSCVCAQLLRLLPTNDNSYQEHLALASEKL
jgi:hypothetical protein